MIHTFTDTKRKTKKRKIITGTLVESSQKQMSEYLEVDPRLERMLADARHEEEERQRKAQQRNANRANILENYQWVRYIIYLWAIRLSFSLLAGVIPIGFGFYRLFFDTSSSRLYTVDLHEYTWRQLLKDDFEFFFNNSFRNQPAVIHHVPIVSKDSLHLLLESVGSKHSVPVKASASPYFVYFDHDRLWAKRFANAKHYDIISHSELDIDTFCKRSLIQSLSRSSHTTKEQFATRGGEDQLGELCRSQDQSPYLYVAYPHMERWSESFAPSLSLLATTLRVRPSQTNLWLSSPGVHAHMHYDFQDNLLLQLHGNKRVTIVSPEAAPVLQSYSSLHPLWRQSALAEEALSVPALHQALKETSSGTSSIYNVSAAMIWQVDLSPGDMVYIPAGFYHSVVTTNESDNQESLSINVWYPSRLNDLFHRLQRISLPFQKPDSRPKKIARVVAILTIICQLWETQNRDCLLQELFSRFHAGNEKWPYSGLGHCPTYLKTDIDEQESFCTASALQIAEFNAQSTRAANEIIAIAERSKLPLVLQTLAVVEYVEEILMSIFSSPRHREDEEQTENVEIDESVDPCLLVYIVRNCRSQRGFTIGDKAVTEL
jgi:hypothetical protein